MSGLQIRLKTRYERIAKTINRAMEPWDYACKWIPVLYGILPEDSGFKNAAIDEISRITGKSRGTVANWGKQFANAPDDAKRFLKMADLLNTVSHEWHLPE